MTRDQLAQMIKDEAATFVRNRLFADDPPYVCDHDPDIWSDFTGAFTSQFGGTEMEVRIVGSGRFGYSLSPEKRLRPFHLKSDIDVVVVSEALFDLSWLSLLNAAYPRRENVEITSGWLAETQRDIYTGFIRPERIKIDPRIYGRKAQPILTIQTQWFNARKFAANVDVLPHEVIKARLYRTWDHAVAYHEDSMIALRDAL